MSHDYSQPLIYTDASTSCGLKKNWRCLFFFTCHIFRIINQIFQKISKNSHTNGVKERKRWGEKRAERR